MERLLVAVVLVLVAVAVATLLNRRRPAPPTQGRYAVPTQLDVEDFAGGTGQWLVVVFTSSTCASCEDALAKARVLASDEVVVREVPYQSRRDLHRRYGIDAVPTTVLADADGVVHRSFVGAPTATDLWAALADMRQDDHDDL